MSVDKTNYTPSKEPRAQNDASETSACTGGSCGCGPKPEMKRRDFIKLAGYGMLAMGAATWALSTPKYARCRSIARR